METISLETSIENEWIKAHIVKDNVRTNICVNFMIIEILEVLNNS